jgi:hypothetical protein
LNDNWADDLLGLNDGNQTSHGPEGSIDDEIDAYLTDPRTGLGSVNYWEVSLNPVLILHPTYVIFRQENQLRYPRIFPLALDILPIQGSAVPCERVFSSSAETDTLRRNRTTAELMEALQMLKFIVKQGYGLDFTAGMNKDDEINWLEGLMNDQSAIPEDITSFVASLLANT